MSQKNIIIALSIIIVLLLGGGGLYLFSRSSSAPSVTSLSPTPEDTQVLELKPEDIGLTLSATTYRKGASSAPAMHISVTKLSDIASIDCEIHYSHLNDDGTRVQEGILCNLDAKGQSSISQDFPFATCSDVCRAHKDIQDIEAIFKVTKTDGKIYQVKDTMSL